jgi:GlpG protein
MRQLGILPDASQAQTLADHLLTLHIQTRVDQQPEGWTVWVCDEDHLPQARQELATFQANPTDSRYTSATKTAQSLRRQEERAEEEYQRRQAAFRQRMNASAGDGGQRVTVLLIGISCLVGLLTYFGSKDGPYSEFLLQYLSITPVIFPGESLSQVLLQGQVWRLITPIFLHFGPMHLLFNMWMLRDLGGMIEQKRGPHRFVFLVLLLAVTSNLGQYFLGHMSVDENGILILRLSGQFGGMSGVLYGLFGYAWMKGRLEPKLGLGLHPNTVVVMMLWFFLCMTGEVGPIANAAHAVGLIVGILVGIAPSVWRYIRKARG